jgi:hypothetical protein
MLDLASRENIFPFDPMDGGETIDAAAHRAFQIKGIGDRDAWLMAERAAQL